MSDKGGAPKAAAGDEPLFLLLSGCDPLILEPSAFVAAVRRMGLRPDDSSPPQGEAHQFDALPIGVSFAEQRALAGRASATVARQAGVADNAQTKAGVLACVPLDVASGLRVANSRELFKLAVLLIDLTGADRLYWSPAGLWSDAHELRAAVAEMLVSGLPPILHLVAFDPIGSDGGVRSRGLAHFSGQEIEVVAAGGLDARELMRRATRFAVDIMINGPVNAVRTFPGLVEGEVISVRPAIGDPATLHVTVSQG